MRLVPWIPPLFRDRAAAGRVLSEAVAALQLDQPVVVGVARGGVAVALEVARELEASLTAIDVERVNAYGLRLGAVTAHRPPYLRGGHGAPEEDVESALTRARRACGCRELGFPASQRIRRRRSGFWRSRRLGCGRLMG
jgi:putative phosphoribosyl transferase